MTIIYEKTGLVHQAERGHLSYLDRLGEEPGTTDAVLSFWYQPRMGSDHLTGQGEYLNLASLRSIPDDPSVPAWKRRVMAFLRRYHDGVELSTNWARNGFARSRRVRLDPGDTVGVVIHVEFGKVEAHLQYASNRSPFTLSVDTPDEFLELRNLELRLGNPGDGTDPGENDRDDRSTAEPGALWTDLRFELLKSDQDAAGLIDPGENQLPPRVAEAVALLERARELLLTGN